MHILSEYKELYHYDSKRSLVRNEMTGDVRMMKRLTHYDENVYEYIFANKDKHIPVIFEYYKDSNNELVVLEEFIQGNTFDVLINDRTMPDGTKLKYFLGLLDGLSFLHKAPKPIIHRDLKPSNIMITEHGEVKILDYDAAKIYKPGSTGDTTHLGTDGIAAPEQYGFMQSDTRSDVYAVGKMLTAAFPDNSRIQKIASKASSFDPKDRYADARELADVLGGRRSSALKLKPLFPPPGFRTRKVWKMLIAIPAYIYTIFFVVTFGSAKNTEPERIILKILVGLYIFVGVDICTSWTGIFDALPFMTHSNRFLRYLFKFIYFIVSMVFIFFVAVTILVIVNYFFPLSVFRN